MNLFWNNNASLCASIVVGSCYDNKVPQIVLSISSLKDNFNRLFFRHFLACKNLPGDWGPLLRCWRAPPPCRRPWTCITRTPCTRPTKWWPPYRRPRAACRPTTAPTASTARAATAPPSGPPTPGGVTPR